ncbi:MAG: VIT1/CCC1 transporter family protein [Alphaproteobacteria bacterium]|nr:VIT1/CCC1 transporter family protein [Alphaproteobacteria bacterium]
MAYSALAQKLMLQFQKDEATSAIIYANFARKMKDKKEQEKLLKMAHDEASHAAIWKHYTKQDVKPNMLKVWWYKILMIVLGYTFVIKSLELGEYDGVSGLKQLENEIPEVKNIIADELRHEKELIEMLDEERLNYVGAMVLGLNDALVELTGTIAGLTFVLTNTTLIAMAGIITGIAATLSMAASNYLAERADGNPNALKASFYTGIAYLVTVVFLVLPYLLFAENMFIPALVCMIGIVVLLVFMFNYYIATVKSEKFLPKFIEMSAISLSVALISFLIGLVAKMCFGIDVG